MTDLIETRRLVLRRHKMDDAAEVTRLISDWNVIKWLTAPPYPYALEDAELYLGDKASRDTFALVINGQLIGHVGLHGRLDSDGLEFGYWLGKPYWGQGLMTEATKAIVAEHFTKFVETIMSGYLLENGRSNSVLRKLGFENTEIVMRESVPLGKEMELQRMQLTADRWRVCHG